MCNGSRLALGLGKHRVSAGFEEVKLPPRTDGRDIDPFVEFGSRRGEVPERSYDYAGAGDMPFVRGSRSCEFDLSADVHMEKLAVLGQSVTTRASSGAAV